VFGWGNFLRLGVACAVFDDDGRVLLSHRGDMDVWNLPTGRLDAFESLETAAAREVHEETGVVAALDHPVGLYYLQATGRLNILFSAYPIGGDVQSVTDESRDNRYYQLSSMPDNVFGAEMARDAFEPNSTVLSVIRTPTDEIRKIRRKLAWRWIKNLLRGRLEPRHVRFDVRAVAVLLDSTGQRVLCLHQQHGMALPCVQCTGERSPWVALAAEVRCLTGSEVTLAWVGLWQQPERNHIEFIFAATLSNPASHISSPDVDWTVAQNAALVGRNAAYVMKVMRPEMVQPPVWMMIGDEPIPDVIHR
jgi:8-oxo-dGTP diphosphatase